MSFFALLVFAGTVLSRAPAASIAWIVPVPPQVRGLSGTLWAGAARLDGGLTLNWQGRWRSLLTLGRVEAGVTVTGSRTLLEGAAFASLNQIGLRDVTGRAGSDILALLFGAVPCDGTAVVYIDEISRSRRAIVATGRVRISQSRCKPPGEAPFDAPPLTLDLTTEGTEGVATLTTDSAKPKLMGAARLDADGWVKLRIEPAGAVLMPGLPASAPTLLEFQLN